MRRAAHIELSTSTMAEPEDHALPLPVHSSMKTDPAERPEVEVRKKRFKVWKTKDWKRRTKQRAQKAEALRTVAED